MPTDARRLVADYLAFEQQRTMRRQYTKAFGGMAVLVLLGAFFERVPGGEALMAAGLLLVLPLALAVGEAFRWHRLVRRLNELRVQRTRLKSRKKVIINEGVPAVVSRSDA